MRPALDHELTIAGGEALRAAGEARLAPGTLMIGLPEWADTASEEELARFAQAGIVPEGYVVTTFAAVEVALQALDEAMPQGLAAARTFRTLLGPVAFDDKGDLAENPFRLLRYDGSRFLPVD